MNFLVKEALYLLDYEDQIKEVLFLSTDKRTPGYAYEINIRDYNTGYSDLSFRMPGDIVTKNGEIIKNPKLKLLVPLSKIRYQRNITYVGTEPISVPNPDGTTTTYPEADGNRHLENYIMDYIVQPLDKSRQGVGINLLYTAIDFPRFNLSKKKVGLTFDDKTITTQELSLYKNTPLSVPGSFQYLPWKENGEIVTWDPNAQAKTYPLDEDAIKKLINETEFSYGILATIFYWPVTSSGRFEGVWYEEGGFITLSLYNTYAGSDWEGSDYLDSVTWQWGHLDPVEHYLSPNNACNYLRYILKDTNWKVAGDKKLFVANTESQPWFAPGTTPTGSFKEGNYYITYKNLGEDKYETGVYRYEDGKWENKTDMTFEHIVNTDINDPDFGTLYDVDIEQVEVSRSAEASLGQIEYTDARYNLSVNNANCYNAITAEAKLFDLYPVFNCVERTASLKLNAGKEYGLAYRYKSNLKNSTVKVDGEKVITKLYVTGGTDAQGEQNITIGEANRIISGIAPEITSSTFDSYSASDLITDMTALEKNIYEHMNGTAITTNLDMSKQKFILNFPDNLYELDTNRSTTNLISFSSGKHISRIYNPTGSDYCYYIYLNDGNESYKNESKQLYKFDGANITLRRNLEEFSGQGLGTITSISTNGFATTTYIKYSPALSLDVVQDGNSYIGNVIDASIKDAEYILKDMVVGENFVLSGPDRVYNVPTGKTTTYNYGVGNYYYIEDTGTYRYCVAQLADTGSIYSKINSIIVNGYVFYDLGASGVMLKIKVNGTDCLVLKDGVALTLKDWLVNDFSLRVIYNGTALVANEVFDPNAPEYLIGRSPYGASYIYNFKYLYDNGWMTEEDILDIYRVNRLINDINLEFYDRYTKDLVNIQAAYNDAINNYDIYSSKADAQLEALMSQYWVNPNKASDGQFSAFPGVPADLDSVNFDNDKNKYYMDITYDEPQGDGTTKSLEVKRVYFDIFNSTSCLDNYPNCTANNTVARNPYTEGQYHVVANALGWENYYTGKLTVNSEIGGYTEAQDPSKTAESYNKFVKQMKEYYYRAWKADEQMRESQAALDKLMERYNDWEKELSQHEKYLQENYGEYIIEGSYSNTEQPYANLLIQDGLEASEQYATPDITYTVGVVDSSGLMEFREPHKIQCNDLIKRLHNVGQVVPHVGDYISILDEPMGMFGVPGLITQIGRRIDDPYQNTITIDTSYTDADELVGNIITATNTVLNNKDIYGRAAIINNKGELSSTTVSQALSTGTNTISIVSTSGKVAVDDNGLTCVNPFNKDEVMRYNGTGVLGSNNGGATWRELMTQDGINANYINAGTINAGKVSITDGGHDITTLNADGLVIKSQPNKPYVLGSLKTDTVGIDKAFENVTVFIGKDANGNGVGYFNGYINATKGGNIAGWTISSNKLSSGSGSTYTAMSSDGSYAFWAGNATASSAPFWVKANGEAHFTNVTVDGNSSINGNNIDAKSITAGKIADGTITASQLQDRAITGVKIGQNVIAAEHIVANSITAGQIASGAITADEIAAGAITAAKVSSEIITTKNFSAQNINADNIKAGTITAAAINLGSGKFKVTTAGAVTSTSGSIGGFTIGSVSLSGSTTNGTMTIQRGSSAYVDFPANGGRLMIGSTAANGVALTTANKLVISDSYGHTDPGDSNATIGIRAINGNVRIASNSGVRIHGSGGNLLTVSDRVYMCNLNLNGTTFTSTNGAQMWCNQNCAFKPASGYSAVVQDTSNSNHKIKTNGGDLSSRNIKTNFEELTPYNEQLLEEFGKVNTYHYDYLYKESAFAKEDDYGFVIDELEEQPLLSKIFLHDEEELQIKDGEILVNLENPDDSLPSITVKRWNSESYIRGLFILTKALHNKVKELEEQLKKEKTN